MTTLEAPRREVVERFPCFGTMCTVIVGGPGPAGEATQAARAARDMLLAWHERFTRFDPGSELSRLNHAPESEVTASRLLRRFAAVALDAAAATGGLVDPTLGGVIEAAGYRGDLREPDEPLAAWLARAGARRPAIPDPDARWRAVDIRDGAIARPPGVMLDGGGLLKGMAADALGTLLARHPRYVVDCGGDLRVGGRAAVRRLVEIEDPFGGPPVHTFPLRDGALATSGIGRRRWTDRSGAPVHHLLDPGRRRPAFTGLVQVSALAPTATRAEALAKAALLAGPDELGRRLPHGGLAVHDDGRLTVLAA